MFYFGGVCLSVFLGILLFTKKNRANADTILAGWLFFIALHLFFYYLVFNDYILQYPYLMGVSAPFPLIHGPFLYFYTASLTGKTRLLKRTWPLHLLPSLVAALLLIPLYKSDTELKLQYMKQLTPLEINWQIRIVETLVKASGIVYFIWSLILLKRHRINIQNQFSTTDLINLRWLTYLTYCIGLIWVAVLTGFNPLIFGLGVALVFFIGYYGLKQTQIFVTASDNPENNPPDTLPVNTPLLQPDSTPVFAPLTEHSTISDNEPFLKPSPGLQNEYSDKIKYKKSGLSQTEAQSIHERLHQLLLNEKIYKNPELKLSDLSNVLGVSSNLVSQTINTIENKNFYDYINTMRVDEFKRLLSLPENHKYTLLSLSLDCGFNSKTSFNRNFKKVTGMSPSEYLTTQKIKMQEE